MSAGLFATGGHAGVRFLARVSSRCFLFCCAKSYALRAGSTGTDRFMAGASNGVGSVSCGFTPFGRPLGNGEFNDLSFAKLAARCMSISRFLRACSSINGFVAGGSFGGFWEGRRDDDESVC